MNTKVRVQHHSPWANLNFVRFEVFTAVIMKKAIFWDMAPRRYCVNRRFGGTYFLNLQSRRRAPSRAHDQILITVWQLRSCFRGAQSLTRGRVCLRLFCMLLALPAQSTLYPSSLGLATIFYCLGFETSYFFASDDSQGHGRDIRPTSIRVLWSDCSLISPPYNISARTAYKTQLPCCSAIVAVKTCLFAQSLLTNGSFILSHFSVVAYQRAYMPQ
jgi:hypothetical protein